MIVFLNGEFVDHGDARVSVDDRAFLFADGVYEVVRIVDGRPFMFDAHVERLRAGLAALRIAAPAIDELPDITRRLLDSNDLDAGDATLYVQVSRGSAARKHAFPPAHTPATIFAAARPMAPHPPAFFERGVDAITVPDTRWSRCDIKSVSLLPNVLANQRAKESGAFEALFVRDGALIEGSHANLFAVVDGQLRTYPACNYILAGITRAVVLDIAKTQGIPCREAPVFSEQVPDLAELFLSGTTTDVMPITRLDGSAIGDGRPGPITQLMLASLRERMTAETSVTA